MTEYVPISYTSYQGFRVPLSAILHSSPAAFEGGATSTKHGYPEPCVLWWDARCPVDPATPTAGLLAASQHRQPHKPLNPKRRWKEATWRSKEKKNCDFTGAGWGLLWEIDGLCEDSACIYFREEKQSNRNQLQESLLDLARKRHWC